MNVDSNKLTIDFLYLDLSTCERCKTTDTALNEALAALSGVLQVMGYSVEVNKIEIQRREQAERYHFYSSPTILLKGTDIFSEVEENNCQDCSDLCGSDVDCRTFTYQGKNYNQPPAPMIVEGMLRVLYGDRKINNEPYILPENLDNYFTALENVAADDSSEERMTIAIHIDKSNGCDCSSGECC